MRGQWQDQAPLHGLQGDREDWCVFARRQDPGRGDPRAADHDMGCREKYTPFGVVNEDSGQFHRIFGSSAKTSDFIVDGLYDW